MFFPIKLIFYIIFILKNTLFSRKMRKIVLIVIIMIAIRAETTIPEKDHHDYLEGFGSFSFPNVETKWTLTSTNFSTKIITSGNDKVC